MEIIVYILLTYGPKPIKGELASHPAAKQQMANFRAFLEVVEKARGEPLKNQVFFDYARSIRVLNSLPNLKALLQAAEKSDTAVFVDDFRRLFARCAAPDRSVLLEDLCDFRDNLADLKTAKRFGDLTGKQRVWIAATEPPVRFKVGKHQTNNSPTDKGRAQTCNANLASKKARQNNADKKARQLGDPRQRLTDAGKDPTLEMIAECANKEGLETTRGNPWSAATVSRALNRLDAVPAGLTEKAGTSKGSHLGSGLITKI